MRFKPSHRTRFLIGLMLCVGATGFWVWKTRTQGNDGEPALARLAASAVGVDARPSPEGRPPSTSRPGNAEPRAVQEARAELEEVRQTLAAAQAIALWRVCLKPITQRHWRVSRSRMRAPWRPFPSWNRVFVIHSSIQRSRLRCPDWQRLKFSSKPSAS